MHKRKLTCLVLFLLIFFSAINVLATPADLDQIIEQFKIEKSLDKKLDLAYKGLDIYAPLPQKAEIIDTDDRNSLSEMKRLMLIDLLRKDPQSVLLSAIGSTGNWLLHPDKIKNDFNFNAPDEIAGFKHKGYYLEGLSDLDFSIMGQGSRKYANHLYELLAQGREGAGLSQRELDELEINFLVDAQVSNISSGGDSEKFWQQMMNIENSSFHSEKYITKGGKALYCIEHLAKRGAAILPAKNPRIMPFNTWLQYAKQYVHPFTVQYLYGGCCDMDYFMRHAADKKQESVKTVLQIVKYLERQAWMIEQTLENLDKLPDGLVFRQKNIEHFKQKAEKIKRFCNDSIQGKVWDNSRGTRAFIDKALALSADICSSAHAISIRMGNELLWRIDDSEITLAQVIMLDEIAYDIEIVDKNRYGSKRPQWYESHQDTIVNETRDFLAAYKQREGKIYRFLVKADRLPQKDPMLDTIEVGPIMPAPVAGIAIEDINISPNNPKPGEKITVDVKGRIEGTIKSLPNFENPWMNSEQAKAIEQVAIWSWLATIRRMEISYLLKQDKQNSKNIYVSAYEIDYLIKEELQMCEDEIAIQSEKIGMTAPADQSGQFKPRLQAQPTMGSVEQYLNALDSTITQTKTILEYIKTQSDALISIAESNSADSPDLLKKIENLKQIRLKSADILNKFNSGLDSFQKYKGYAQSLKKIKSGDFNEAAAKAKEIQDYLEKLSNLAETAVSDTVTMHNDLNDTIAMASFFGRPGSGLSNLAQTRQNLNLKKIPELRQRAKWLNRGQWAARSAKYALIIADTIKQYNDISNKLAGSDLSTESENAVIALAAVGNIITRAADLIPLTYLQQAVKDYASLLSDAAKWATAFDSLQQKRYQSQGYAVRSVLIPEAYKNLISKDKLNHEEGRFYRYSGPFADYNNLIVFAYPSGSAPAKKIRGAQRNELWLIWDKSKPNGFLKLSPETFKKASLYCAWFNRVEQRPITGIELHDLLISGEIPGGMFFGKTITVAGLRQKAADILRMNALLEYLAMVSGKNNFTPDEVRRYYGLLDRAARLFAQNGFLIKDHDIKQIISNIRIEAPVSGSWKKIMGYIPSLKSAAEAINSGTQMWDSLSGGEKQRFDQVISDLIKKKKMLRTKARKKFWQDKRSKTPSGLTLKDIKLSIQHEILTANKTIRKSDFLNPRSGNFKFSWKQSIPKDFKTKALYKCIVELIGYAKTNDVKTKVIDFLDKPEPVKPIKHKIEKQEEGLEEKITYYEDGNIRFIDHYKNGKKHGRCEWYGYKKDYYGHKKSGLILRGVEHWENGKLQSQETLIKSNGEWKWKKTTY